MADENQNNGVVANNATPTAPTNPAQAGNETGSNDNGGNSNGGGTITGDANNKAGASPAQPVTYDFKSLVPEDLEFDQERSDKFVDVIKDMNLSSEQANAIVKYGMDWGHELVNDIVSEIQTERQGWKETSLKELGADKDKVLALVGTGVEYVEKTVPGIRAALNETGAGDRIELIRAFEILGKMLQSDPGKTAGSNGSAGTPTKDPMYPNTDWSKYQ